MDINQLKTNPHNPRIIMPEMLAKLVNSIRSFPQMLELRPIIFDKDNTVVGGNARLLALRELIKEGFEIKDTYFMAAANLTQDQIREFIIKDNVPIGDWDWEKISAEWDRDLLSEWGLDIPVWADVDKTNEINGQDEWTGMPEFDNDDSLIKIMINFQTEEAKQNFLDTNANLMAPSGKQDSYWCPPKARAVLKDLKYDEA